ncbi:hypothetical protein BD779DRAFT_1483413, partial [Infundibulicybe gibba]
MFRNIISSTRVSALRTSASASRSLHSTPVAAKTVTEKVSEVAENVNKSVGRGLASAIETGEKATENTKETLGSAAQQTKDKADHASNVAGQKTNQAAAGAHEAKKDFQRKLAS